jgi:hypothetical protein
VYLKAGKAESAPAGEAQQLAGGVEGADDGKAAGLLGGEPGRHGLQGARLVLVQRGAVGDGLVEDGQDGAGVRVGLAGRRVMSFM